MSSDQGTERAAFTAGLRELADWLDEHPEVQTPYLGAYIPGCPLPTMSIYVSEPYQWQPDKPSAREQLAQIGRAMGKFNKGPGQNADNFIVWRTFAGLAVFAQAARAEVCERVVTGTREVTVELPDPEAMAAVPKVTVTKTVEDVEWVCGPLLAGASS
jgi:hypothetical protein